MSEFIAERIWPGARIERSIFGTDDPEEIWRQVLAICPEAETCFAFEAGVGARLGLLIRDGTRVALKVHLARQDEPFLHAVQNVQRHLWDRGFPCPRPLGVRRRATLEEWRDEGAYRDGHDPRVRCVLAQQLARLFRLTDELQPLPGMEPFFPAPAGPLWPTPHNALFDFGATTAGAEWIDEIAVRAKRVRDSRAGRLVIGHNDWTAKHFRFDGLQPAIVYDWDSLATDFETLFVGYAAATFTYTEHLPVSVWPRVDEARAFIGEYVEERGEAFEPEEQRVVKAAAVYSRAYAARCTHAIGRDARSIALQEYAEAFL